VNRKLVLGTRGSDLALRQTRLVEDELRRKWSALPLETKIVRTSGDEGNVTAIPAEFPAGRKGLFTGEIERALRAGEIDLAIHSAKDLPSELTPETEIAATLPRAACDDVLVSLAQYDLASLPLDGIVATGSVRRRHQLRWKRPDLEVVDLRGNVPTRLRKLATDEWHAAILARAGLERLGLHTESGPAEFEGRHFFVSSLPTDVFVPAGGQGIIAVQIRREDDDARMLLEAITHFDTRLCLRAEREFLRLLQADCNQPVGVHAVIDGDVMKIRAQIFELEASTPRQVEIEGNFEEAENLAASLFDRMKQGEG
jgi:hydroxymethylbilane synthase